MASNRFCVLALAAALLVWPPAASALFAQDSKQMGARSAHPIGLDVAYEWQYSCPEGRGCSFACPGAGGATNVMKLNMYLGSIPVGKTEHATGVFMSFLPCTFRKVTDLPSRLDLARCPARCRA
jgi:hypothetical protein